MRQWITRGKRALGLVSNVKNWLKDGAFLLEFRNIQADHLNKPISFGAIEDEDRATIANITGNGNDLVLSNFGFAEGSGYGLYAENYNGGRWVKSTNIS